MTAQRGDEALTASTCPQWHRDSDGWCIDERPHLAARRENEPCVCDTDFTCMALEHDEDGAR